MAKGPGGFSVGRVSVKVVPDTSDFRKDLLRQLKAAVKGIKVEIPVQLNAKTAIAQAKILDQILKKLDRTVTPNINLNSINKTTDLDKLNKGLDKLKDGSNKAADGFTRMSHGMLIAVAVFILAAPVIALVATLLAGLPSLLLAILAPVAAIALGMEGFGKAAEKFQPTIDRLRKSLSQNFQDGLTPVFERLNKLAPVLDKGLNKVADGLIHILDQLSLMLTATENMKLLETILENVGFFLKDISVAINQGVLAFLKLGAVASKSFGILTGTLNQFSTSFLEMVDRISESGALTSALEGLNKVLAAVLESFVSLFESGIKAMSILGGPMAQFISSFLNLVVELMPALTTLSNFLFKVLSAAFGALMPVVQALTPGFQILADTLGTLLVGALKAVTPVLTAVARIISAVLVKALTALQPFIPIIIDFFTKFGELMGEFVLTALKNLMPFLDLFLGFFTQLLTALIPLLPVLMEFATQVMRTLADILAEIGPELVVLGQDLFPKLLQIINDLVPIVGKFLQILTDVLPILVELAVIILSIVIPIMQSLLGVVNEVWPSIKQIIEGAMKHIEGVIDLVLGIVTGDWDRAMEGLKKIWDGGWEVIKGVLKTALIAVVDFFIGLPARIATALFGLPAQMELSGKAIIDGLIRGIKSKAQAAINEVLNVVNTIRALLPFSPAKKGPFSGKGYTLYSGQALMEDWARGIAMGGKVAEEAVLGVVGQTAGAMELEANIASDGYGSIADKVAGALAQWGIQIDANGLAKMVNNVNRKNERR